MVLVHSSKRGIAMIFDIANSMQTLAEHRAEEARQHQRQMKHTKQQLALYHEAQEAAQAEAQAAAVRQAEETAMQVRCLLRTRPCLPVWCGVCRVRSFVL